jgi:hypothetical protein
MADPAPTYYAYCVVAAEERPELDGAEGVDSRSGIDLVGDERLAAVVSTVSREDFGEEALRRNLEDLAWLERTTRAHQAVLKRVLEQTTSMVPMRLCTIFEGKAGVREMLGRERELLLRSLERVRDHSEWSVKALADPAAAKAAARRRGAAGAPEPAAGGPGHAFVARKQAERSLQGLTRELVDGAADAIHERLSKAADAATLLPPQRRDLSGRSGAMVLNGAYLVHGSRAEDFKAAVEELRDAHRELGLDLELAGPWAPYNFVATERQPA